MLFLLILNELIMITEKQLLDYNRKGLIPGPKEKDEDFFHRIKLCEDFFNDPSLFIKYSDCSVKFEDRIKRSDLDWVLAKLSKTFDISPEFLLGTYSNHKLYFWQGAATWIFEHENKRLGFIQLRKRLKEGNYLFLYDKDEILVHEAAHFSRMAFDESFEEIFAYLLSSNKLRKVFGPLFGKESEALIFISGICSTLLFSFLSVINPDFFIGSFLSIIFTLVFLSFCLFRLGLKKMWIGKAAKKLFKILKIRKYVRATLFRMSDQEIKEFSKMNEDQINSFVQENKERSLRWKMIDLAYFQQNKEV